MHPTGRRAPMPSHALERTRGNSMSYRLKRTVLSAACLLLPVAAAATDLIPVEDFARHVLLSDPELSPDGKHIAVNVNDVNGDSHALVVYDVTNMKAPVSMLRLPKFEVASNITWVSNTRLVLEKGRQYGSIDKPSLTGEILATDFDGKHQDYLYGYDSGKYGRRAGSRAGDNGWGSIDGLPTPTNGHFYMSTESWDSNDYSTIYDVDATRGTRHLIGQLGVPSMSFMVGADGKAHYAFGTNEDFKYEVYYRQNNGWAKMPATHGGYSFIPRFFTPDQKRIYASYAAGGGPLTLVEQDENGSNRKVLASDRFSSIGTVEWTPLPYQPFATDRVHRQARGKLHRPEHGDGKTAPGAQHEVSWLCGFHQLQRGWRPIAVLCFQRSRSGYLLPDRHAYLQSQQVVFGRAVDRSLEDGRATVAAFHDQRRHGDGSHTDHSQRHRSQQAADGASTPWWPDWRTGHLVLRRRRPVSRQPRLSGAAGQLPGLEWPRRGFPGSRLPEMGYAHSGRPDRWREMGDRAEVCRSQTASASMAAVSAATRR